MTKTKIFFISVQQLKDIDYVQSYKKSKP